MSTNSAKFELKCFKRYFMLFEFMKLKNLDRAIMLDSDIMTYANFSELKCLQDKNIIAAIDEDQITSFEHIGTAGPQVFFCTIEAIDDFTKLLIDTYENNIKLLRDEWLYRKQVHDVNQISDMVLLSLWARNHGNKILRWHLVKEIHLQYSANDSDGSECFEMDKILKIKKIFIKDNFAYLRRIDNHELIRVGVLHFQGNKSKIFMKYYSENTNYFLKILSAFNLYIQRSKFFSVVLKIWLHIPYNLRQKIKKIIAR